MMTRPLNSRQAAILAKKEPVVTIVNRKGHPVGYASEEGVHSPGGTQTHRGVQIVVVSADKSEIVLRYRTKGEHAYTWGNAGVTHVYYGEEFRHAARRELNSDLGLGLTNEALVHRLMFHFDEAPCIATRMEFVRFYSLTLNNGEVLKSRDALQTLPVRTLRDKLYEIEGVSPPFRLLMLNFIDKVVAGPRWRRKVW
jgi:ADP-ribose pyrophosphatase YjhB (NUDIX family)